MQHAGQETLARQLTKVSQLVSVLVRLGLMETPPLWHVTINTLTQPLSKCEKIVENGKKVKLFQDSADKTLIQIHEYLGISLPKQEGFFNF